MRHGIFGLGRFLTHKVILHPEPLGAVLLQEALQQLPAGVRHVGLEHGRLVQDVVVHLGRVATVERRLRGRKATKHLGLFDTCINKPSCTKRRKVTDFTYKSVEHLVEHRSQTPPVHRAVVRLLLENLGGQVLRGRKHEGVKPASDYHNLLVKFVYRGLFGTSGVPQKVVVVPLFVRPSLQRPKSVRTMCP